MPGIFYAASTRGFYSSDIHVAVPADAVVVSEEKYLDLLAAQGRGCVIVPDAGGHPVATQYVPTDAEARMIRAKIAEDLLKSSDSTVLRYYEEGQPVPKEWVAYRTALRRMIGGEIDTRTAEAVGSLASFCSEFPERPS
jgi:hypothetical protein